MTVEELSRKLHSRWSPDSAQEALATVLSQPVPPRDPLAFCNTIAWRHQVRERYPSRDPEVTVVHVSPGVDYARRVDHVFGLVPATQLARAETRQALERLHVVDINLALGHYDPPVTDPVAKLNWSPRKQWEQRRRRKPRA